MDKELRALAQRVIRELHVRLRVPIELPMDEEPGAEELVHEVVIRGFITLRSLSPVFRWQRRRLPVPRFGDPDDDGGTAPVVRERPRRA